MKPNNSTKINITLDAILEAIPENRPIEIKANNKPLKSVIMAVFEEILNVSEKPDIEYIAYNLWKAEEKYKYYLTRCVNLRNAIFYRRIFEGKTKGLFGKPVSYTTNFTSVMNVYFNYRYSHDKNHHDRIEYLAKKANINLDVGNEYNDLLDEYLIKEAVNEKQAVEKKPAAKKRKQYFEVCPQCKYNLQEHEQ